MFPETPQTLLKKIADLAQGNDAAEWEAFVELYTPPLKAFVRSVNGNLSAEAVDDAVQDVFIRLVNVLRAGKIDRTKAKFRAYLATMVRRLLIDRYRESLIRPQLTADSTTVDAHTSAARLNTTPSSRQTEGASSTTLANADPGLLFDARWRLSVREAAIDHVLTQTAVSAQSKSIYRALLGLAPEHRGRTPREIAIAFDVSYDVVKQVKSRLDRAVTAIERQMGE